MNINVEEIFGIERDWDDRPGDDLNAAMEEEFSSCWEVRGYADENDFNNFNGELLDEFIDTKDEAISIANECLRDYFIIKVQTHDREEIEIIRAE